MLDLMSLLKALALNHPGVPLQRPDSLAAMLQNVPTMSPQYQPPMMQQRGQGGRLGGMPGRLPTRRLPGQLTPQFVGMLNYLRQKKDIGMNPALAKRPARSAGFNFHEGNPME